MFTINSYEYELYACYIFILICAIYVQAHRSKFFEWKINVPNDLKFETIIYLFLLFRAI